MNDTQSTPTSSESQPFALIIFDLEETLVPYLKDLFLPGVGAWLDAHGDEQALAVVANAGGVGLQRWRTLDPIMGNPKSLPTADEFVARLKRIVRQFPLSQRATLQLYVSYAYQRKRDGAWSPVPEGKGTNDAWDATWRKPAPGMLIRAMQKANTTPAATLLVGIGEENSLAAANAGCAFMDADAFFERKLARKRRRR